MNRTWATRMLLLSVANSLVIISLCILLLQTMHLVDQTRYQYLVQKSCDAAMLTNNYVDCQHLQSKYHMEFICATSTNCWVEVK